MAYNSIDGPNESSSFIEENPSSAGSNEKSPSDVRGWFTKQLKEHKVRYGAGLIVLGVLCFAFVGYNRKGHEVSTLPENSSPETISLSNEVLQSFPEQVSSKVTPSTVQTAVGTTTFPYVSTEPKPSLQVDPLRPEVGPAILLNAARLSDLDGLFQEFLQTFPNAVNPDDATSIAAKRIFQDNIETIQQLNDNSERGGKGGAVYGVTKFSLLTFRDADRLKGYHGFEDDDFIRMAQQYWHEDAPSALFSTYYYDYYDLFFEELSGYVQYKPDMMCGACGRFEQLEQATLANLPNAFDWRAQNAVTPVKDQGRCGASYAFAVADNIASSWFLARHSHNLIELSPQYIASCGFYSYGCMGGGFAATYPFIHDMGIFTEKFYPFTAGDTGHAGWCKGDLMGAADPNAMIHSWTWIPVETNEHLKLALLKNGPLVVGVNSDNLEFYHGGVDSGANCSPTGQDHAMLLVGWASQDEFPGREYWILKNSWGSDWGENGYWRVEINGKACGVTGLVMTAFG